ncbi:hypothetical protein BU15DRAFT_78086 [Melanogaster broomeanus]|nr:hypothetical protein BU15DRAFT_78086 [Melanogaster broomeanus]
MALHVRFSPTYTSSGPPPHQYVFSPTHRSSAPPSPTCSFSTPPATDPTYLFSTLPSLPSTFGPTHLLRKHSVASKGQELQTDIPQRHQRDVGSSFVGVSIIIELTQSARTKVGPGTRASLGQDRQIYAWETGPPPHEIDEIQSNARPARARSRFLGGFGRLLVRLHVMKPSAAPTTTPLSSGLPPDQSLPVVTITPPMIDTSETAVHPPEASRPAPSLTVSSPQPQPTSSTHRLSTALTLSAHFGPTRVFSVPLSHQPVCLFWPRLCIFGAARAFAASPAHYPSAFSPIRRFSVPPASSARFGPARAFSAPLNIPLHKAVAFCHIHVRTPIPESGLTHASPASLTHLRPHSRIPGPGLNPSPV